MQRFSKAFGAAIIFLIVAACASGPKYSEVASSFPALSKSEGRIYFYRLPEYQGSAVQPEIRVNGIVVGKSTPNGFFFVDRPPGEYTVATSTEVERSTTFRLNAGETKYVKTFVSMGFFVGHVTPELQFPEQGRSSVSQLVYTPSTAQ